MKVGEIFTTERIIMGGTGYRYAPVRLTGEVALLNSEVVPVKTEKCGVLEIQHFTFLLLRPGQAEIQFARFRSFEPSMALYEEVLPFDVEPANENEVFLVIPGGWSPFEELTGDDCKVFDKAMEGLVGVTYTLEKVSKQIVGGTNYRFLCHGVSATKEAYEFPAIIKVYCALGGEPVITAIRRAVL